MLKKFDIYNILHGSGWNIEVKKFYDKLLKSQFFKPELSCELKILRIRYLIKHAYETTRFYRHRFKSIGITPSDIQKIEDLELLPPLTREDLNNNFEDLISKSFSRNTIHSDFTGGSTGLPTKFARSNICLKIKKANEFRFNSWAGYKPGERILYYWPAIQDLSHSGKSPNILLKMVRNRQLPIFAGKLNPTILKEHLRLFTRFKPHIVRAFPSALQVFCDFLADQNANIPTPKAIITVGETLNEFQRQQFEKTLECPVYNCYVSRECGNIASECREHDGLHVADELLHLEVANSKDSKIGDIYITDLTNFGMPFIRYKIQDASRIKKEHCRCGRTLPRIDIDTARLSDYLISPVDGSIISGASLIHYLFAEGPKVGRFQVEQDRKDHLIIRIAGNRKTNEERVKHIEKVAGRIFQNMMKIDYEYMPSIPLLNSGKYQFVKRSF